MHATITCVVGRRGFGKSRHVKETLIPAQQQPVVVLDPKGEYDLDEVYYTLDGFLDAPKFWRASCRFDLDDSRALLECLFHYSPHLVVIEEAHLYCSPNRVDPGLDRLIRMGRLPCVSTVLITQRARDLPQIIYTMADRLVVFHQRGEHDIAALEYATDEDASAARSLPRDEFLVFDL